MSTTRYSDAIGSVLERLRGVGYEFAPPHVNHAPMAAEAMAWLGYTDEVSDWVEQNTRRRRYADPPEERGELPANDPAAWGPALGGVADWPAMFRRQLNHIAALEIVACGQAGHHAPEDRPREIADAIRTWVDRHQLRACVGHSQAG